MRLHVAHLLPNLAIGGRERLTNALCRELERQGHAALMIGYDPLPPDAASLPALVSYVQLDRTAPGFPARLRDLLIARRVDVVHAQGHVPAWYLALAARGGGVPARLATLHIGLQGTWRWLWPIRRGLRAMDRITAVSTSLARQYRAVSGRPVDVIANGIDLESFAGQRPTPPATPVFRFAMLSRLDRDKRPLDAVRAVESLVARDMPVELHIAGEGELSATLRGLASERPWLVPAGAVRDPAAFFADKHAFLLPSRTEAMPMALAEAMAAGLPPIVSDIAPLRAMASDAALYAPVGDIAAWADAMRGLIRDEARWRRRSDAARGRALRFDIRQTAQAYLALYTELVRQDADGRRMEDV